MPKIGKAQEKADLNDGIAGSPAGMKGIETSLWSCGLQQISCFQSLNGR